MKFNHTLESIKTYEAGKPIELVVREYGIAPDQIARDAKWCRDERVGRTGLPRAQAPDPLR